MDKIAIAAKLIAAQRASYEKHVRYLNEPTGLDERAYGIYLGEQALIHALIRAFGVENEWNAKEFYPDEINQFYKEVGIICPEEK